MSSLTQAFRSSKFNLRTDQQRKRQIFALGISLEIGDEERLNLVLCTADRVIVPTRLRTEQLIALAVLLRLLVLFFVCLPIEATLHRSQHRLPLFHQNLHRVVLLFSDDTSMRYRERPVKMVSQFQFLGTENRKGGYRPPFR